jgi:hypothetical protein
MLTIELVERYCSSSIARRRSKGAKAMRDAENAIYSTDSELKGRGVQARILPWIGFFVATGLAAIVGYTGLIDKFV